MYGRIHLQKYVCKNVFLIYKIKAKYLVKLLNAFDAYQNNQLDYREVALLVYDTHQ